VDLGLDPVDGEGGEPHAPFRVEAAHRLHEAHVAFLDEVGLRQPVAHVVSRHRDDEPQVRKDQVAGGREIFLRPKTAAEFHLAFRAQSGIAFTAWTNPPGWKRVEEQAASQSSSGHPPWVNFSTRGI